MKIENYIPHNLVHHATWMMLNFELLSYNKKDALLISMTDVTSFKRIEKELQEHASRMSLLDYSTAVLAFNL